MQKVSNTLLNTLRSDNRTEKRLAVIVEFYSSDAVPSDDGFDPSSDDFLFGAAKIKGINFRGQNYKCLIPKDGTGSIKRTLRKQLSSFSVKLSNSSREMIDFERETGFEGLICVARLVDRTLSFNLDDSIVLFTGRCEKPDTFDRASETVSISVTQILNGIEINIPRRKYTVDDLEGRAPSDPLFEGFRYTQREGAVSYQVTVRKSHFFGLWHSNKREQRTAQYSSHSDLQADKPVSLILGRVQMQLLNFAWEDKGNYIALLAMAGEGEITAFENVRSITPNFPVTVSAAKRGELGGTGNQINDDPAFVGAGVFSRTSYLRLIASGTAFENDDPAPAVVAIILGLKMPVPDANGVFSTKDFSDNLVIQSRWLLNSEDFFNLADGWFDDADIIKEADYCDHILVDQANTDTVLLDASQEGIAGEEYHLYQSTGVVSPAYWRRIAGNDNDYAGFLLEAGYRFYDLPPYNSDDILGTGFPAYQTPPTNYRRRYTGNVLLNEQMKAIDFLFDILFPAFNGYLIQKANGKFVPKAAKPEDFSFVKTTSTLAENEIHLKNINPFAVNPGRILIGANLPTSEVRSISGYRYDTNIFISITATGGIVSSAASLSGGSNTIAPSATITVSSAAGAKSINIDGYLLNYVPTGTDDLITVAAILAAQINSHNELNKYVKAVWTPGASAFVVSSRVGFLTLDSDLLHVHREAIQNPSTAPTATASAGPHAAGTYKICFSYETAEGETLTSNVLTKTILDNQKINVAAVTPLPGRVTKVNWYTSFEANGIRTRLAHSNTGEAWSLETLPKPESALEPVVNSTGEEVHRVAMAFTDKASTQANLQNSNVLKGSFKFPLGGKSGQINRVDVKNWRDASQDFALTELRVNDRVHQKKVKKTNPLEINGAAIDNHHQASRIGNQKIAELRDGDTFHTLSSDGEALLLEEGDVICNTDESGRFINEPLRVEDILITDKNGYVEINTTSRKYRRRYFDDQIAEKLVPLPIVNNRGVNTEQTAPVIWQFLPATNTTVQLGVNGYTDAAKFRRVLISDNADMSNPAEQIIPAALYANNLLPNLIDITKEPETTTVTKYFTVAHSSNGRKYSESSNVLGIRFAAVDGTGGTGGGGEIGTGGGGVGGGDAPPGGGTGKGGGLVTL